MLTSLLPGLREVRAPLVAGTMILFSVVLFVGDPLTPMADEARRSSQLDDLLSWIGRPGLVAAALVVSYLIGSLTTSSIRWFVRKVNLWAIDATATPTTVSNLWREARRLVFSPFSEESLSSFGLEMLTVTDPMTEDIKRELERASTVDTPETRQMLEDQGRWREVITEITQNQDAVLRNVFQDGPRRLRLVSADLHGDYDRQQSEAELRDGLPLSTPVLLLAVLLNTSLSIATEIVASVLTPTVLVALFIQARQLDRAAHSLVLGAVTDHTMSVSMLDPIDWDRKRKVES